MGKKIFALILPVLFVIPDGTFAQNADEIVRQYRQKVGALMTAKPISIYLEGTACSQNICFPARLYFRTPYDIRMELTFQNMKFFMISNDSIKWDYNPIARSNKITRVDQANRGEMEQKTMDFVNEDLYYFRERNHKLKLLPAEKTDSLELHVLELTTDKKEKTRFFLSKGHYLIHRIEDNRGTRQFYHYYEQDQFLFPRTVIERGADNNMEMRFSRILFDQKFDDEMFIIPDSAYQEAVSVSRAEELLARAAALSEQARYDSAVLMYSQAIREGEESEGVYNLRGLAFLNSGDFYAAIGDFNKAIEINPSNEVLFHNRGLAKYHLNDYDNALKDYNASIALKPEFASVYEKRGLLYFRQGKYSEAVKDFTFVLEHDPKSGVNYFNRGAALAQLERYDDAITDYKRSAGSGYGDASLFNYAGVSYYQLQQYDTALINFEKAIEIDPDELQFLENLGRTLYALGAYEQAEEKFSLYLQRSPDNPEITNLTGLCVYFQEEYQGAIQLFNSAIALNPKEAAYFDNRAAAKELLEDFQGAIEDYSESIRLYPNDASVFYKRGLLKIHTSKKIEGCLDLGTANEMKYEEAKAAILEHCN